MRAAFHCQKKAAPILQMRIGAAFLLPPLVQEAVLVRKDDKLNSVAQVELS
ncbi:hypothetical protein SAMN02910418_02125 [Bowdeniella nasicola]|uniref:Uncharacterized protein n=1 Tax=Bowdeniella nasicola TaxID=208480 RepID=A0A1H4D101_9ACTO|nr:hypothetical protein SAMN02910418_02125 [Bowdeniella nasicola]